MSKRSSYGTVKRAPLKRNYSTDKTQDGTVIQKLRYHQHGTATSTGHFLSIIAAILMLQCCSVLVEKCMYLTCQY